MPDHFASIGLVLANSDEFGRLVGELGETATRERGKGGTRALWEDESGARFAMFLKSPTELECAKPSFRGMSRTVVRPRAMLDDPGGCAFCAIASVEVLEGDAMVYPLFVELDDVHLGPLTPEVHTSLSIVAFAEELKVWADEAAYSTDSERPKFATQSLIPSGMFTPDGGDRPPRAEAILTGVVTKAERRTNQQSGATFDTCTVATLATEFDVVATPQEQPFEVGNVIQGTFWLIARRLDAPSQERRGLGRFFGRRK